MKKGEGAMYNLENLTDMASKLNLTQDEKVRNETSVMMLLSFIMGLLFGLILGMLGNGLTISLLSNNKMVNKGNGCNNNAEKATKKAEE